MKKISCLLMLFVASIFCGCDKPAAPTQAQDAYSLVVANPNAVVYRINRITGEVMLISGDKSRPVKDAPPNYGIIGRPVTTEELLKGLPQETNVPAQ